MNEHNLKTPYEFLKEIYNRRIQNHHLEIHDNPKLWLLGFKDITTNDIFTLQINHMKDGIGSCGRGIYIEGFESKDPWEEIEMNLKRARSILENQSIRQEYIEGK